MRSFLWTFAAVLAGIFVYSRYIKAKGKPKTGTGVLSTSDQPDFDPLTGSQITAGNGPGTVGFTSSPIDNFTPLDKY